MILLLLMILISEFYWFCFIVRKIKKKGIIILHLIFDDLNESLKWSKKIKTVFQNIIIIKQYELSIYLICLKDVKIEFD